MSTGPSCSSCVVLALACVAALGCDRPASKTQTTSSGPIAKQAAEPSIPAEMVMKPPSPADWMSRLDPDMREVIGQLMALDGKPIETLSAVDARKQPTPADAVKALLEKKGKSTAPEEVAGVEERTIHGPGGDLPIRIHTPAGKRPMPVVVYYHGGGWVLGSNDSYDATARALANGAGAIVLAVEYRKGPENKFPAAHDDAVAAYEWALKNAATIGGDPNAIAVAGEGAGGNLAANVAIAARDKKEKLPRALLLVYPIASTYFDSPSERENTQSKPLDQAMMAWFTQNYFRTPDDGKDRRIDLVNANLRGLPPTLILNAEVDPLRSDGELLATKMREAGVTVDQKTYTGVTHGFFGMAPVVAKARAAERLGAAHLDSAFGR